MKLPVGSGGRHAPGVPLEDTVLDVPDSGDLPGLTRLLCSRGPKSVRFSTDEFALLKARRGRKCGREAVVLARKEPGDEAQEIVLLWIEERGEWICVMHRTWLESQAWGEDESWDGPYRLEPELAERLLRAFAAPPDSVPLERVPRTSPDRLRAAREDSSGRYY